MFRRGIKDAEQLLQRFDAEYQAKAPHDSKALKRAAPMMALATWQTPVKDRFRDKSGTWLGPVKGRAIGPFALKKRDEHLRRFFNQNSDRTARLFVDDFDVDVTRGWQSDNDRPADTRTTKAGADAHPIRREELDKAIS